MSPLAPAPAPSLQARSAGLLPPGSPGLAAAGGSAPPHLPSTLSLTPGSLTPGQVTLPLSLLSSCYYYQHPQGTPTFTHFPVPPLIPVAGLTSVAAAYPKSPFLPPGFATPPSDLHSPGYPWSSPSALSTLGMFPAFSPLAHSPLPFPPSSLLSPAPSSYHSSSNSSREELPGPGAAKVLTAPKPRYGVPFPPSSQGGDSGVSSSSPAPSSPLLSPHTWSHSWPTPAWQVRLHHIALYPSIHLHCPLAVFRGGRECEVPAAGHGHALAEGGGARLEGQDRAKGGLQEPLQIRAQRAHRHQGEH